MEMYEISQIFPEVLHYYDPQKALELASEYVYVNNKPGWKIEIYTQDIDETNIAKIAMESKSFNFLKDPEEEGYNVNDGKPIC